MNEQIVAQRAKVAGYENVEDFLADQVDSLEAGLHDETGRHYDHDYLMDYVKDADGDAMEAYTAVIASGVDYAHETYADYRSRQYWEEGEKRFEEQRLSRLEREEK